MYFKNNFGIISLYGYSFGTILAKETKQIEIKDSALEDLNKKNNSLEQEKEKLFIDYQKQIEELQLQILDSASSAMDSTSGLCKVIDILNSNVDEFKIFLRKKLITLKIFSINLKQNIQKEMNLSISY